MQPQYTAYNPYAQQQQYDAMTQVCFVTHIIDHLLNHALSSEYLCKQQQQYHMSMQASQPQQLVPQATAYKSVQTHLVSLDIISPSSDTDLIP